jgi:hypothetical protein
VFAVWRAAADRAPASWSSSPGCGLTACTAPTACSNESGNGSGCNSTSGGTRF